MNNDYIKTITHYDSFCTTYLLKSSCIYILLFHRVNLLFSEWYQNMKVYSLYILYNLSLLFKILYQRKKRFKFLSVDKVKLLRKAYEMCEKGVPVSL